MENIVLSSPKWMEIHPERISPGHVVVGSRFLLDFWLLPGIQIILLSI
jgi:hypothetical protein